MRSRLRVIKRWRTCRRRPGEITARFVGETVEVLVEDEHKGKWRGRTRQNKLVFLTTARTGAARLAEVFITWAGPLLDAGQTGQPNDLGASPKSTLMCVLEAATA